MDVDPEMLAYYEEGREQGRLVGTGRLEFLRTQLLLGRYLPPPPARIIDVGGAAGIHAVPLAAAGYEVSLVDRVALHVDQAQEAGIADAVVGDARRLPFGDGSVDVALLLGPLYHLPERGDRIAALREARRVTRPGGLLIAAVISRFASTQDGVALGYLAEPAFERIVEDDLATGRHRNPTRRPGWFTTAYLHRPDLVDLELVDGGWEPTALVAVEGPGAFADTEYWLDDPVRRDVLLRAIDRVDSEPSLLGASPHLLAVGTRPQPVPAGS